MKINKKEIPQLLIAVNASNDLGFKYPFGNLELVAKLKDLEEKKAIEYCMYAKRWVKV